MGLAASVPAFVFAGDALGGPFEELRLFAAAPPRPNVACCVHVPD